MNSLAIITRRIIKKGTVFFLTTACFLTLMPGFQQFAMAEGTRQLEPEGAPSNSICRLALIVNDSEGRIPFALKDCDEDFRLNIRINDFVNEKIQFGLGSIVDYYSSYTIYTDVKYQVKDPAGNIVAGYSLKPTPQEGEPGYIETREQALAGPNINGSNPEGYEPLTLTPAMNGDYILEFEIPTASTSNVPTIKYIDITVAKGVTPVNGRLWSKAWQFSSGSVYTSESASYSSFYVYTNDSIVTRFDCNGFAGGVWAVYSNEWGCSVTGHWSERRKSIHGNTSVKPQHRIFLNDPDPLVFKSGNIGEMLDFKVLPHECDTVITFWAEVSKGGNIEVILDVPPLNPNSFAPEDVQLGYNVVTGANTLLPGWNGKNAYGTPLTNGTQVEARITFLNGLSNIPLFDVEDNPNGFKVDIIRPLPASPSTILKLYWDDTNLPAQNQPTSNSIAGCKYSGIEPVSGCHDWPISQSLGDINTINSWWYFTSGESLIIPITLKLSPASPDISGPTNICSGMLATFKTRSIPFSQKYFWQITGPGFSVEFEKDAPDTTLVYQFTTSMTMGNYTISVYGRNTQCGDGEKAFFTSFVYDDQPPPITGSASVCTNLVSEFLIPGTYTSTQWNIKNGTIVGSPEANPVSIRWNTTGTDTISVMATNIDCGTRLSVLPVIIHQPADAGFMASAEWTTCPGLEINLRDTSKLAAGTITERIWTWDDGQTNSGNAAIISHSYPATGTYTARLEVTSDKGCKSLAERQIQVIAFPEASFSASRNCLSHAVQLSDNSTGINITAYNWNFGSALATTSNLNEQQPTVVFHTIGQFPVQLIVTNKYGCRDTVIQYITIHNNPKAEYTHEIPCQSAGILFTDQSTMTDTLISQYSWNSKSSVNGEEKFYTGTPSLITFGDAATYMVDLIVTDANGCTDTITKLVAVKPKPATAFDYIENADNIMGKLHFTNHTTGATEYYWDLGEGNTSTQFEPEIKYSVEGNYTIVLIATSADGCHDTAYRHYYYMPGFWLPDSFTPDGDGKNDIFKPVTQRISLKPYLLNVYTRWGQLIFSSSEPETGWDGTLNSGPCPGGLYTYFVQYKEDKIESSTVISQRGTVLLIR
jgi:gliding motility-associated-like protein